MNATWSATLFTIVPFRWKPRVSVGRGRVVTTDMASSRWSARGTGLELADSGSPVVAGRKLELLALAGALPLIGCLPR
jgi:hypothetical protein